MDAPTSDGIHMTRSGAGIRFDFEAGRHHAPALLFAGGALPFAGFAALFLSKWGYFVMNTAGLIAALIAGVLIYMAIRLYTEEAHLSIRNGLITAERKSLVSSSKRQHPVHTLLDVKPRQKGQVGQRPVYSLALQLTDQEVAETVRREVGAAETTLSLLRGSGLLRAAPTPDGSPADVDDAIADVLGAVKDEAQWAPVAGQLLDKTEADWIAAQILAHADRELQFA